MSNTPLNEVSEQQVVAANGGAAPTKRRRKLRRWLKILGIIFALLLVVVAVVIIWLGPIAEWYLERNDKDIVGRRIEMDNLSLKLFSGEMTADNIILYESDESTPFASIDHIDVEMEVSEIFSGRIHLSHVHLTRPYLSVVQDGEVFNFDDMVEFIFVKYVIPSMMESEADKSEDDDWEIVIENVTIEDGHIEYLDREMDQRWSITALNMDADEMHLGDELSHLNAQLTINDSASVDGILALNCESFDFDFTGSLKNFNLGDTYKYWTPYLNIGGVEGVAEAEVHLKGNIDNIFAMDIDGDFLISGLNIVGADGGNVLSSNTIGGSIEQLNIDSEKYIFHSLYAQGYASQFILSEDGSTNFDTLFPEDTQLSVETTTENLGNDMYDVREEVRITTDDSDILSAMELRIASLKLEDGEVYYADNTLHKAFTYDVSDIDIEGEHLDLEGRNDITIKARVPKQGSVTLHWEGALSDFYNQTIMATLTNVDIESLEPYIEYFTAFPVESGNLTFRSMNVITNGELNGVNQLGTYNFKLGKRDKSMDVDFNLPLRLGVYILTDKDDHIDIELPVTGNVESPEFSYRKAILRVVGNLLLKIVAAPFEWMSGDKQEAFRHINFEALDPSLTSEHYARLDKMAETLKGDEELSVRLTHTLNYDKAAQEVANLNLKIAYYNSTQSEEGKRLDMLDFAKINDMRLSNSDVHAFADSMLVARNIDPQHMSMAAKARELYGEYVDGQLLAIAQYRNRIVGDYLKLQHPDLREGAITIQDVKLEDIVGSTSRRSRYTVSIVIDGEEMAVNSPEDEDDEVVDDGEIVVEDNNLAEDTL